jgi:hypothetical protein
MGRKLIKFVDSRYFPTPDRASKSDHPLDFKLHFLLHHVALREHLAKNDEDVPKKIQEQC